MRRFSVMQGRPTFSLRGSPGGPYPRRSRRVCIYAISIRVRTFLSLFFTTQLVFSLFDFPCIHLLYHGSTFKMAPATAAQRVSSVLAHLNPPSESGKDKLLRKNPDDIVGCKQRLEIPGFIY